MSTAPYVFRRMARNPRSIGIVALWLTGCGALYVMVNAHPVIAGALAAFSLPALYDIVKNSQSDLRIDGKQIAWRSGRRSGDMPRGQLEKVRLDTRLDFSRRMTLYTHQGGKLRLPYECVPPIADIEAALQAHDIAVERHYFALIG